MPTSLTFDQHLAGLERAAGRLAYHGAHSAPDAPVPTCPGWTQDELLVHQSVIHRWAEANLRGRRDGGPGEDDVRAAPDRIAYFLEGYRALAATLVQADPELEAAVFLNDAPPPRHFWARRQCHETTIHSVDALAADRGRVPAAEDCAIDRQFAVDGIDELLTGFVTRSATRIHPGSGRTIAVVPSDSDRAWVLRSEDKLVTTPLTSSAPAVSDADTTFSGTAAQLYLGLWNRGDEIVETGDPRVLDLWRDTEHVTWS
ncbi:maleylpyruvate isomerase N-terminal domain-containing protein [Spelaeicoccus albus]|uniref:Uncharacterized protein (TIGR03083 family) n=1 Tax=Spelaeicoccus albus TaxID=1280376 RepID=A0A7Z0AA33_9MICO|nr:maleylpyruvate isomerase N-terminal domain-containing protein [Spelaeicoccus albus]NYI66140.1 uncharacterized protein (TIGR03083 family) [Spelaeicoccus albus]